jgi:hypothetical protein
MVFVGDDIDSHLFVIIELIFSHSIFILLQLVHNYSSIWDTPHSSRTVIGPHGILLFEVGTNESMWHSKNLNTW